MSDLTLETLAQRLAALERKVATLTGVVPPSNDWRSVVGMFARNEFNNSMEEEILAIRAADQKAFDDGSTP